MPKIHHKFDDNGAPMAKTASSPSLSQYGDALNSANRGVKRDFESNPKGTPPTKANNGRPHPQQAGSFYGNGKNNKRQKLGGGGFKPTNKLNQKLGEDKTNGTSANGTSTKGIKAKNGLKSNSSTNGAPRFDPPSSKHIPKTDSSNTGASRIDPPKPSSKTSLGDTDTSRIDPPKYEPASKTDSSNIDASKIDPPKSKSASKTSLGDSDSSKLNPPNTKPASKTKSSNIDASGIDPPNITPASKTNSGSIDSSKLDPVGPKPVSKPSLSPNLQASSHTDATKTFPQGDKPKAKEPSTQKTKKEVNPTIEAIARKYEKYAADRRNRKKLTPAEKEAERLRRELLLQRRKLPIWLHQAEIRIELREKDVMLLIGETGSGKSTQVPQFLCNEPWMKRQKFRVDNQNVYVGGTIAITEPRKVAATNLARRVAQEMGGVLQGDEGPVGYSVRFQKWNPRGMKIKFLTEGMLLMELLADPHLKQYSAVIVDEVHERSLNVDLLTGFLKQIVTGDKEGRHGVPLKVVVMSATVNTSAFRDFFEDGQGSASRRSSNASEATHVSYSSWGGFSNDGNFPRASIEDAEKENRNDNDGSIGNEKSDAKADDTKQVDSKDSEKPPSTVIKQNSDSSVTLDEQVPVNAIESSSRKSNVTVHHVEGRQHLVRTFYVPEPISDYLDGMHRTILKIHTTKPLPGDILCFLAGQDEIETVQKMVEAAAASFNTKEVPFLQVMTLYGSMGPEDTAKVFRKLSTKRTRKVVLSTNIAETSVTVPGVRYVVDSGKVKIKQFRHNLGIESLLVKPISQSSALQRKGRAGRESEGECYRLYTELEFLDLPVSDVPEILRTDIVSAVLSMKANGVENPATFPLIDPPQGDAITKALNQLFTLGALSKDNSLTKVGTLMSHFPLSPAYARVLIAASTEEYDCAFEAIDAISCLSADGDIFKLPASEKQREATQSARDSLNRREGDIMTILNTIRRYLEQPEKPKSKRDTWCEQHQVNFKVIDQATKIRKQLQVLCARKKLISQQLLDPIDFDPITEEKGAALLKCFLKAFADKTAILHPDKSYRTTVTRDLIAVHPSSVLHGKKCEAILFLEQVYTSKHFAKKVNMIQMDWMMEALVAQRA